MTIRTILAKQLILVSLVFFAFGIEPSISGECDWLYSKHIDLYRVILRNTNTTATSKIQTQERFHRFAFECWLKSQTNQAIAPLHWRGYIRGMIHKEAMNERCWNDPALLLPHFNNGKLVKSFTIVPIHGLNLEGLSETSYTNMVGKFQLAYFDFEMVFPPDAVPEGSMLLSNEPNVEETALAKTLEGKKWSFLWADRLPAMLQDKPVRAFKMLSPKMQAYYFPAFMRMCEMSPEYSKDLAKSLVAILADGSSSSKELRSYLNENQIRCIIGFFEPYHVSSRQLRRLETYHHAEHQPACRSGSVNNMTVSAK